MEVKENGERGKAVFATRLIHQGQILLEVSIASRAILILSLDPILDPNYRVGESKLRFLRIDSKCHFSGIASGYCTMRC